jgi:hypothetical protein
MLYLEVNEIIIFGSVCLSLRNSANDEVIWKANAIEIHGDESFNAIYGQKYKDAQAHENYIERGIDYKEDYLRSMKARKMMFTKSAKPVNFKLVGHKDTI